MPPLANGDRLTKKEIQQMQYDRCSQDWQALDAEMWQIPTILIGVNTLILAVAFGGYVNSLPIRSILLGFGVLWSVILMLGFDRITLTQTYRSEFMHKIEANHIAEVDVLSLHKVKMIDWLSNNQFAQSRTPHWGAKTVMKIAGVPTGLALGGSIVIVDILLLLATLGVTL
jgi:hypothetical protein